MRSPSPTASPSAPRRSRRRRCASRRVRALGDDRTTIVVLDLGAPVVFWQERIGQNGRKFLLYKFRSFRAPFDRAGATVPSDRRASRIGQVIRKSRLDEIPQLWNVVRGEMALIGPRPLLPIDQPADPSTRLLVRPGITGWAQVNGGTALTAEEKDALDSWYIRHASPILDLQVAWRTIRRFGQGERSDAAAIEQAIAWRWKPRRARKTSVADRLPRHAAVARRRCFERLGRDRQTLLDARRRLRLVGAKPRRSPRGGGRLDSNGVAIRC